VGQWFISRKVDTFAGMALDFTMPSVMALWLCTSSMAQVTGTLPGLLTFVVLMSLQLIG
jgi:hypothetical protein